MAYGSPQDNTVRKTKGPPPPDLDALLRQFQAQGGLSAGPEAPSSPARPTSPARPGFGGGTAQNESASASGAFPAANSNQPTSTAPGWAGVVDVFKQLGGMTPDQYTGAAAGILKQIQAAQQPAIKGIEQNIKRRDALVAQPVAHPAPPKLQPLPEAPDTRIKNPLQVFQSSAAILGMLGSLFTRRPLVTAMNSAAAAIKGYAEGDKAAAERAHQSWKDSLEQAVAQNQTEMQQYNALLQDANLSISERTAQLQALAASNNDQNMLAALRSGAPQMAFQILDGRQKSAQSLTQLLVQAQQHEEGVAMERARLAETQRHNQAIEGGNLAGRGPLDMDTVDMLVTQYLGGDASALQGLGYGRQGMMARRQVLDAAAARVKGQGGVGGDVATSKADYKSLSKSLGNLQNYVVRADTANNVFLKNLRQVDKYMVEGVGGDYPVLNKWIQAGRKATGDPDVAAFDAAIKTASREYARIMSGPTSNAQLTVSAQQNADEMLSEVMNIDQLNAVMTVMKQDVQNSIDAASEELDATRSKLEGIGGPAAGAGDAGDDDGSADFQEGDIVEQDGHHYKFHDGAWEPQD